MKDFTQQIVDWPSGPGNAKSLFQNIDRIWLGKMPVTFERWRLRVSFETIDHPSFPAVARPLIERLSATEAFVAERLTCPQKSGYFRSEKMPVACVPLHPFFGWPWRIVLAGKRCPVRWFGTFVWPSHRFEKRGNSNILDAC